MPTYDYECEKCGVFEHKQSIKDDAFEKCPKCGGSGIKRLVSRGSG
ncbi:MAG TPA: zinc ribbon domain-containing protein, partial [Candidatus Goldiibacteriota bacterium]|nr:zinc ribbon domain-containing protein [Candidatus Goldiibacteriota bacterium]